MKDSNKKSDKEFDVKKFEKIDYEKYLTLNPGQCVEIKIDEVVLISKTIPIGKTFKGRIAIEGDLYG